jgi:hypothetical protein
MPSSECRKVKMRDGRTLAYAEYGSPSGRPIIYCHGVPSSRVEADLIVNGATAAALGLLSSFRTCQEWVTPTVSRAAELWIGQTMRWTWPRLSGWTRSPCSVLLAVRHTRPPAGLGCRTAFELSVCSVV